MSSPAASGELFSSCASAFPSCANRTPEQLRTGFVLEAHVRQQLDQVVIEDLPALPVETPAIQVRGNFALGLLGDVGTRRHTFADRGLTLEIFAIVADVADGDDGIAELLSGHADPFGVHGNDCLVDVEHVLKV